MKKKRLSLMLAMALVLTLVPVIAFAADSRFEIRNGILRSHSLTYPAGEVVIPDGVTAIADSAFANGSAAHGWADPWGITSVVIPDGVTRIGRRAFMSNPSLASVTIPASVTAIGTEAFAMVTQGSSVPIPGLTLYVEEGSFAQTFARNNGFRYVVMDNVVQQQPPETHTPPTLPATRHIPVNISFGTYNIFDWEGGFEPYLTLREDWTFDMLLNLGWTMAYVHGTWEAEGRFFEEHGFFEADTIILTVEYGYVWDWDTESFYFVTAADLEVIGMGTIGVNTIYRFGVTSYGDLWNHDDLGIVSYGRIFVLEVVRDFAAKFPCLNTASEWAREGITTALLRGFVPIEIQGDYTNVITRAEFCRMAVMWLEDVLGSDIDTILAERGLSRNPNAFTDTNDPYILAAFALGITSGVGNNLFNPNGQFSREQAATMVRNTCRIIGMDMHSRRADFTDIGTASLWAIDGINFVAANGIMQGTGNNYFSPHATFTREQSILTFNNISTDFTVPSWVNWAVLTEMINISPGWVFSVVPDCVDYGPGFVSVTGNDIHLMVWAPTVGRFSMLTEGAVRYEGFQFADGYVGVFIVFEDSFVWAREDSFKAVSLHHAGDTSVFYENRDLIMSIARSLR